MRRTLPNRAQPGLHAEPLDAAIGKLLAPYFPGVSAMVIDGSDTTNTHTKLVALRYITAYAKLVKKDTKDTLYSSHWKCELVEIAIDSKKAETISNFSSY